MGLPEMFLRAAAAAMVAAGCLATPLPALSGSPAPDGLLPFAPQLTAHGRVNVIRVLADGRIALGGDFHFIDGQPRHGFALLDAEGALAAPTPAVDGVVHAVAEDSAGRLYLGGTFAHVDGQPRWRLARLLPDGQLDTGWNPVICRANCTVHALAVVGGAGEGGAEGLLVGGLLEYPASGPISHRHLLRLRTADAQPEPGWVADPDRRVRALLPDGQGGLFVGGDFDRIGVGAGLPLRYRLARLHLADAALDITWSSPVAMFGSGPVNTLMLSADGGQLYVGGRSLWQVAGGGVVEVARVDAASGAPDPAWQPPAMAGETRDLAMDGQGRVHAGGSWLRRALRFNPDGSPDPAWAPPLQAFVNALAIDPQGRVHVGGELQLTACTAQFGVRDPLARSGYAVFDDQARLLPARDAERSGRVQLIAAQPDGGLLLGREPLAPDLDRIDGYQLGTRAVVRLDPDGRLDRAWQAPFETGCQEHECAEPLAMLALPNNRVLLAGILWHEDEGYGETDPMALWQVYGDGSGQTVPAAEFGTRAGNAINTLARDAQGRLLLGGGTLTRLFDAGGQHLRRSIARLDGDTGLVEPGFDPGPIPDPFDFNAVWHLLPTAAGALYVAGRFDNLGGVPRTDLGRLHGDGSLDPAWAPVPAGCPPGTVCGVRQLAADSAGRIHVAGGFQSIDGVPRAGLARLAGSGPAALDPAWDPDADGEVNSILPAPDDGLLVGGRFGQIGGLPHAHLARLDAQGQGDPSWAPQPDGEVRMLVRSFDDSRLYVAGDFRQLAGQTRTGLAAFAMNFSAAPVPVERIAPAPARPPAPPGSLPVLPAACLGDGVFANGFELP